MPVPRRLNTRVAHCGRDLDDSVTSQCSSYRLLFPFEDDPLTEGLWWEVDRQNDRWRTVGWNVEDPDVFRRHDPTVEHPEGRPYDEEEPAIELATLREALSDEDTITARFGHLDLGQDDKIFLDSHCVCNEVENVRQILRRAKDPHGLIAKRDLPGEKPILLATCEEGHIDVVRLLLEYFPPLEAKDNDGNTALFQAISYGWGRITSLLIEAGASTVGINSAGQSVLEAIRVALREHRRLRKAELHPAYAGNDTTLTRRRNRELEIRALENILEQCEIREAKQQAEQKWQSLCKLHGRTQAQQYKSDVAFDQPETIQQLLTGVFSVPLSSPWKTVGCLTRNNALPLTFAVSGYTRGIKGFIDGSLDRPVSLARVFKLARLLEHTLAPHLRDGYQPGSFLACHAEKQLLAFMLWNHTTAFGDVRDEAQLIDCEPTRLSRLRAKIFVYQPAREQAAVCDDCISFCAKAVDHFGMTLALYSVGRSGFALSHCWPPQS
jgi:hypothetical protein